MGTLASVLEEAGIATVIIAVEAFRTRMEMMTLPRVLITPHPMGRPMGPPGNRERQRETIEAALNLLETAEQAGTIREMPGKYAFGSLA